MQCVVTGCAGFIGSHLTDYLISCGHDVTGVDSLVPGRGNKDFINPAATFVEADIRDPGMRQVLSGADWVFHLAAVSVTPWAVADPVLCNDVNVSGTVNLLEAACHAEVLRFVNSSSNIVYAPFTPYWASKVAAENYAQVYATLYGLPTVSLRYANVFGSLRQGRDNCIMSMRTSAREDGFVWVSGDGGQSRDFINVADVCRANRLAAESSYSGSPLDICTGTNHTMAEIASRFGVRVEFRDERAGDVKHIFQDPRLAEQCIGFKAEVSFEAGLEAYL